MKYFVRYVSAAITGFVCLVYIILIIAVSVEHRHSHEKPKTMDSGVDEPVSSDQKIIRWYDAYHNGHGLRMKSRYVDMRKCQYNNCRLRTPVLVSGNEGQVRRPINADAVIFQACHLGALHPPARRDSNQVFVFAERESWWSMGALEQMLTTSYTKAQKHSLKGNEGFSMPDVWNYPQVYLNTFKFRHLFNWTMTYRRDSDIPLLYGDILPKPKRSSISNAHFEKLYNHKTKSIVWLVSDCHTYSKREYYVEKLKQYINVDVYGMCGNYTCPKGTPTSGPDSCISKIVKKYKFVLSFENTFHKDYVTEKLFDWFPRHIVQVVYGMADYASITPRGTVINAADFSSPKHLAEYLTKVGNDKQLYIDYLKRKDKYYAVGHAEMQQAAYCKLCEKLNNVGEHRKTYSNVISWWQLNDTKGFQNLLDQAMGNETFQFTRDKLLILLLLIIGFVAYFCLRRKGRNY